MIDKTKINIYVGSDCLINNKQDTSYICIQAVTGVVFITFILGMFYRSASLYHPQRRAILHLKSIKRKIKEKNKSQEDRQPFFDISCLKSVTFRIILLSTGVSSFGLYTPLIYLVRSQGREQGRS